MSITVKPEIFQQTKQTILKNKQQFIQIQLSQVIKRITKLKLSNSKLKSQIKQLKQTKCKQKQKMPISKNKISLINKTNKNMKNKQKDKVKQEKQKQNQCSNYINNYQQEHNDNNSNNRIQNSKQIIEKEQMQLKQLQNLCNNQQKQKEKQLEYFEDYIKILKKMWEEKQIKAKHYNITQNLFNNNTKICDLGQNSLDSLRTVAHQKYYTDRFYQVPIQNIYNHENNSVHSNNSLNCSSLNESIQSGTVGNFNDQTFGKGLVKRKTMSLSLNNSIQVQPSGFNFGKKLINKAKAKMQQTLQVNHFAPKFQAQTQRPSTLLQNCMKPRHSQNLNSSLLSHSQSRSCISNIPKGNLQTSASSSTSQLKRIQPSKSYAKIITKLQCTICHIEYRPNQYYMHLNECRQLEKIRLLHQKSRIEDEINQTLNLSLQQL